MEKTYVKYFIIRSIMKPIECNGPTVVTCVALNVNKTQIVLKQRFN